MTGDCHIENWLDLCLKERPSNDGVQRYPFSPSFPHPSEGGMVNSCMGGGGRAQKNDGRVLRCHQLQMAWYTFASVEEKSNR